MELAEEKVAQMGLSRAQLMVFKNNSGAIEFYEKQGWRPRSELVVMSKDMPQPNKAIRAGTFGTADY